MKITNARVALMGWLLFLLAILSGIVAKAICTDERQTVHRFGFLILRDTLNFDAKIELVISHVWRIDNNAVHFDETLIVVPGDVGLGERSWLYSEETQHSQSDENEAYADPPPIGIAPGDDCGDDPYDD